jgi:hypothetical protein
MRFCPQERPFSAQNGGLNGFLPPINPERIYASLYLALYGLCGYGAMQSVIFEDLTMMGCLVTIEMV